MDKILNYWYQLEFFSPSWPVNERVDINVLKKGLPWPCVTADDERVSFDVYIGKTKSEDMIKWMTAKLGIQDIEKIEPDNSQACVCALKVNSEGKYTPGTFIISPFIWAVCKFAENGFGCELKMVEMEELQKNINDYLVGDKGESNVLSEEDIEELYLRVCQILYVDTEVVKKDVWAKEKVQRAHKINGEIIFNEDDTPAELFPSFYIKDILKVKTNPTDKIRKYTEAMKEGNDASDKVEIDVDTKQMKKWLDADKFPMGMWPSAYSPCLMQQLGINIAISDEQKIFSVNGPLGTGKTTLLKEIIASNLVKRAIVMSKYNMPDDAFKKESFLNPPDQYNTRYYVPDRELTQYGIIVASNNNAAVENISKELPKKIKKDRTGLFSKGDNTYFADIASEVAECDAWGLISASLGKKSNIKKLVESLWWSDKCNNLKKCYEDKENIPDWKQAKEEFNETLSKIYAERKTIKEGQKLIEDIAKVQEELTALLVGEDELAKRKEECRVRYEKATGEFDELKALEKIHRDNIMLLKGRAGFFKTLLHTFFTDDPIVSEWRKLEEELDKTVAAKVTKSREVFSAELEFKKAAERAADTTFLINKAQNTLKELKEKLQPYAERFGESLSTEEFWTNIECNEESQSISPWTDDSYDALREELFYKALMLNKAFVLNSNAVKQNLKRLFGLWDDRFDAAGKKAATASLLNTLMILIPVISTTFASVHSFLGDVDKEELGTLIIDEAGQATAQSALGAIWRTGKAVIVGDPLQVEPILTVPKELQIRLADENSILPEYRLPELSVQMLGDRLNKYGGKRYLNGEELWLGCPLVLHRRCIEPMFSISNEIAYNNRMFLKTAQPEEITLIFKKSFWLDVKGKMKEKGNQNVEEQNTAAIEILESFLNKNGYLPDLFIISPFKKVAFELRKKISAAICKFNPGVDIEEADKWAEKHCGTVHTFQGKEANEVILVLGCDSSIGNGAAKWVGQKPNIINVAVSRAKYRICVIGDFSMWSKVPNAGIMCNHLPSISKPSFLLPLSTIQTIIDE